MWPWGHLAVGYLTYTGYTRYRDGRPPTGASVVWLALGTQFADLLDKPLAYWWLLPEGRALGHSLVFAVPFCLLLVASSRGTEWRSSATAFALAYATHLVADSVRDLASLEIAELSFLAWPLLESPDYEASGFTHHVETFVTSVESLASGTVDYFAIQILLFVVATVVWSIDGAPPLGRIGEAIAAVSEEHAS